MAEKGKTFFERLTGSGIPANGSALDAQRVDFVTPQNPASAANQAADKKPAQEKTWMEEAQEGQLTIDVYQTPTESVIKSTVAGVMPEDLDVTITNDMVTIKGARKKDEEVQDSNYYYQECYWGSFSRSIILPLDVAADRAEAALKNGILTIRLPKVEKEQSKKIKVKGLA